MYGSIPEDDYARVLMGTTYLDNCPLLKPGAKPLNDMATNRQRNLVMSSKAFIDKTRARAENAKMGMEDKESREMNLKVYRPEAKLAALQEKKEQKNRIEREVIEARRGKRRGKKRGKERENI